MFKCHKTELDLVLYKNFRYWKAYGKRTLHYVSLGVLTHNIICVRGYFTNDYVCYLVKDLESKVYIPRNCRNSAVYIKA